MLTLHRKALAAMAMASVAAWTQMATAQQPVRPVQPIQTTQPQGNQTTDHILEQWLIMDNHVEIELAKFAENRAQSEDVRKFAVMLQEDHTDFVNNLKHFHENHAAAAPGALPARGAAAAQPHKSGGFNVLALKHELAKQCLSSMKEELSKVEGRQFDTCYMGHQVTAHMQMLDTLKVFKQHATPELAELLSLGIDTTEDHLMHAMKWMKEHQVTAETVSRPSTTEKR
jgi:predicted outer membrane protein